MALLSIKKYRTNTSFLVMVDPARALISIIQCFYFFPLLILVRASMINPKTSIPSPDHKLTLKPNDLVYIAASDIVLNP